MSNGLARRQERLTLLSDAAYFATELSRKIEALAEIEQSGRVYSNWQQAAAMARKVRAYARHQADEQRHKAKLAARRAP